jgi:hypothetical protein
MTKEEIMARRAARIKSNTNSMPSTTKPDGEMSRSIDLTQDDVSVVRKRALDAPLQAPAKSSIT